MFTFQKKEPEVEQSISVVGEQARKCLDHEYFKEYRSRYAETEQSVINEMQRITQVYLSGKYTLQDYGAQMLVLNTKIKALRQLLYDVSRDARKGKRHEKEEV